ncbi:hypothetical protein PAMC26510_36065 [Caballeronia sordidicola]|uniref:Uncharacterized protein n=1 Tax=Caballeronia sordidicola TaxID=196367 RepID=A0A242M4N1_CABSO|nr:hypothetical protein PAMC26510_36065 [Caballeronia sordidicola]
MVCIAISCEETAMLPRKHHDLSPKTHVATAVPARSLDPV